MKGSVRKYRGAWIVRLDVGKTPDGKRKQISRSFRTKREADEHLAKLLAEVNTGTFVEPSKLSVAEYLNRWLETVRPSLRPNTFRGYSQLVGTHIAPAVGGVRLQELRPLHVQELYSGMLAKGLSPRTVQYVHAVLHRALDQAVKWNLVPRNVTEAVEPPRLERKEMQTLTPDEARRLLEAARGDRFEALWVLALTTGMRQGELLGLRWKDIDFRAGTVTVNQTLAWDGGRHYFSEPKTRTSRRTIPLTAQAVEALKAHKKRQNEERLKAGKNWHDLGLVFTSETGDVLKRSNLQSRWWPGILKKAGITRKIRFHDLRHTVATFLLAQGLPVKTVQAILGHATAAMTLDRYGHVLKGAERAAAETMEKLLGGK